MTCDFKYVILSMLIIVTKNKYRISSGAVDDRSSFFVQKTAPDELVLFF